MSHTPSAILAVSSTDRYTIGVAGNPARKDTALLNLYEGIGQPGNQFQLSSSGAFIYGYIKRIIVSQIQIDYRIPTIVPSNGVQIDAQGANDPTKPKRIGNDKLAIGFRNPSGNPIVRFIQLPYGFYTPEELAAMLTALLLDNIPQLTGMLVTYRNAGEGDDPANPDSPTAPGLIGYGNSFLFYTDPSGQGFFFPNYDLLKNVYGLDDEQLILVLKTYTTLGITAEISNSVTDAFYSRIQTASPNFLFTPYIDIVSNNLTKFQKVKDSDTTTSGRVGMIARMYLSGVGAPVNTTATSSPGCEPFIMTADLNNPKIIRWNKDETVYNLDFSLYDQYGDLIYWTNNNPTEFQMTLLCQEEDE
jgi:hypothetical protein